MTTTPWPADRPALRWTGVCLDCADAEELAQFYARLLGWEVTARDEERTRSGGTAWLAVADPDGGVSLNFQAEEWYEPPVWPEQPGAQAKMVHMEILVGDIDEATAHALACGAVWAAHQPEDRDPATLRVMLDPAGHPFCLCTG